MQTLVPVESVIVVREGKRKQPPIGKGFPFTDAEVREIRQSRPDALRRPVNEVEHLSSQSNVRTAAGRVAEGGIDTSGEGLGREGGEADDILNLGNEGGDGGEGGGQSDEEIERANQQAAEEKQEAALRTASEKAIKKAGGGKALRQAKAAKAPAVPVDDDL